MIRVALLLLALAGCGSLPRVEAPPPLPGYGAGPSDGASLAATLRARRDRLEGELAGVRTRLESAEREAREAPLRGLFRWGAWIGGALVLAGIVAAVLLRGTWPLWFSAAGAATVVAALTGAALLPYAVPLGIGCVVALVAALAWWARRRALAAGGAIGVADALKAKLRAVGVSDDERREIQRQAAGKAGAIIDRLRGKRR